MRKRKGAPPRVPVPPEDGRVAMEELREAQYMERYEFVAGQRTLNVPENRMLQAVREKFGLGREAARQVVRECLAAYVSDTAEAVALNKESAKRRVQHVLNHQMGISTSAMKGNVPDYVARSSAARACAQLEKFLAELQGTLAPTEIQVTTHERREVFVTVLDGMTEEELAGAERVGEEVPDGRGEGPPGTTH